MTASHLFRTFGEGCNNSVPSAIDLKSNSSDTRTLAARCKNATTSESTSAMGTDIGARPYDVRFTPKSGHQLRAVVCPLCAKSGHQPTHSITSSALASTEGGMLNLSAFAVLRLMTSSIFVGACTGRSWLRPTRL